MVVFLLLLSGCGCFLSDEVGNGGDVNKYLTGSHDAQCDALMKVLSEGINRQDVSLVKSIFSEETKNNCPNLDQQIRDMFTYLQGKVLRYEGFSDYANGHTALSYDESGNIKNGQQYWQISGDYQLEMGNGSYDMTFAFYSNCVAVPEKNGIYFVEVMPEELADSIGYQHSIQKEQGVFLG